MNRIFESFIGYNSLVFDVGSNMGDKSEVFLNLGADVVGFEPQYECFSSSIERFLTNSKFRCENIALDQKVGESTMFIASYHTISSMSLEFINESKKERFTDFNWDNQRIVRTDTIENMIIRYGRPDFIKIDVEGYELNVLKGLKSSINMISVEFNPELCKNTIDSIEYIDKLNNNKTLFNYGYRNDEHFKYNEWQTKESIIQYLRSVNDFKFEFGDVYCKKIS